VSLPAQYLKPAELRELLKYTWAAFLSKTSSEVIIRDKATIKERAAASEVYKIG
jgi:hypothetical protein